MILYLTTDGTAGINGQVFDIIGGDISIYLGPVEELIVTVPKVLLEASVIRIMPGCMDNFSVTEPK